MKEDVYIFITRHQKYLGKFKSFIDQSNTDAVCLLLVELINFLFTNSSNKSDAEAEGFEPSWRFYPPPT